MLGYNTSPRVSFSIFWQIISDFIWVPQFTRIDGDVVLFLPVSGNSFISYDCLILRSGLSFVIQNMDRNYRNNHKVPLLSIIFHLTKRCRLIGKILTSDWMMIQPTKMNNCSHLNLLQKLIKARDVANNVIYTVGFKYALNTLIYILFSNVK